jgi:hypothetical protein
LLQANDFDRFAQLRERYRRHLVELRGFSSSTLAQHTSTVADLLKRALKRCQSLEALTPSAVEHFVALKSAENNRKRSINYTVSGSECAV